MQRQLFSTCLFLSLTLGALAGRADPAPQKYRLREPKAAGDQYVFNWGMEMGLTVQAKTDDRNLGQLTFGNRHRECYTQQFLSVDQKGPAAIKRSYRLDRSTDTDPTGKSKQKVDALEGKTVLVRRTGDKTWAVARPRQLPPEDRKSILKELNDPDLEYVPEYEVAPGEEWTVDPKVAAKVFTGMEKAEIKCRFQDVIQMGGHPCARIRLNMDMVGHLPGWSGPSSMRLSGYVYQLIDLKRPLAREFSGPTTLSNVYTTKGKVVNMAGAGTMHVREVYHWVKVNGKAVGTSG
jgi:hypothetical protein